MVKQPCNQVVLMTLRHKHESSQSSYELLRNFETDPLAGKVNKLYKLQES